jgi:hypothetical protein
MDVFLVALRTSFVMTGVEDEFLNLFVSTIQKSLNGNF